MTNKEIAAHFKLLAQLIELFEGDSFKINSYSKATRVIEKYSVELSSLNENQLLQLDGVGKAIGNKIIELNNTGTFRALQELVDQTPEGIIEMLKIKGLGPKKVLTIWKDLGIESIGELLYACNENRLLLYKGFGEKTQLSIKQSIEFYLENQGSFLFSDMESFVLEMDQYFKTKFSEKKFLLSGSFLAHQDIIEDLLWITDAEDEQLEQIIIDKGLSNVKREANLLSARTTKNLIIHFQKEVTNQLVSYAFMLSCSKDFLNSFLQKFPINSDQNFKDEVSLFSSLSLAYIPPYLRQDPKWINCAIEDKIPKVIQPQDIKGVIHAHSKYSDGSNSLRDMAIHCKDAGFQYLVISDHSQSAFYAQGLKPDRILEQHAEIDLLNKELAPFKIFKSIESDILNDGSLDYSNEILNSFDLVIASIHSNLKMDETKAMNRLLNAINNPFTSILGHMTGRLLLSRPGYPVNLHNIIDACLENQVVIELNANPRRLDMDWRNLQEAFDKGVLISIDPDAHSTKGIADIRFGVLAAQKAGTIADQNLSCFNLAQMESFISTQKVKRSNFI